MPAQPVRQPGDPDAGLALRKSARGLALQAGNEAFFPNSSREIASICEGIARDIRNRYTLAYTPTIASQDGRYRTIEVKASAPGRGRLSVRTRAGYSVPLTSPATAAKALGHDAHN